MAVDAQTKNLLDSILDATQGESVISDWSIEVREDHASAILGNIPQWAEGCHFNCPRSGTIDEKEDQAIQPCEEYLCPEPYNLSGYQDHLGQLSTIKEEDDQEIPDEIDLQELFQLSENVMRTTRTQSERIPGIEESSKLEDLNVGQPNNQLQESIDSFKRTAKRHPDLSTVNPRLFMENIAMIWGNPSIRGTSLISPISVMHMWMGLKLPIRNWIVVGITVASLNKKGKPGRRVFFVASEQIITLTQRDMQEIESLRETIRRYKEEKGQTNLFVFDAINEIVLSEKLKRFGLVRAYVLSNPERHHLIPSSSLSIALGQVQSGNVRMFITERKIIGNLNTECQEYNLVDLLQNDAQHHDNSIAGPETYERGNGESERSTPEAGDLTTSEIIIKLDKLINNQASFQQYMVERLDHQSTEIRRMCIAIESINNDFKYIRLTQGSVDSGLNKVIDGIAEIGKEIEGLLPKLQCQILGHLASSEQRILRELCDFKTTPLKPEIPTPNIILKRSLETLKAEMELHSKENIRKWSGKINEIVKSENPDRIKLLTKFMIQERAKEF